MHWRAREESVLQIKQNRIVTKLKNSNCDETQTRKLWQNLKTQIVTKHQKLQLLGKKTQMVQKLKNSKCNTTKKEWSQNSKTQNVTKFKNSSCEKTLKNQIVTKLQNLSYDNSNSNSNNRGSSDSSNSYIF